METKGKTTKRKYNLSDQGRKNITGRLLKFVEQDHTPEDIERLINEYFDSACAETMTYFVAGKPKTEIVKIPTFPGLCWYIGLESREAYNRISKDSKNIYSSTLKNGYLRLQNYLEKLSIKNSNPAGPVFILKNMDYSDQTTVNQNVTEVKKPEIITPDKETGKEVRSLFKHTG